MGQKIWLLPRMMGVFFFCLLGWSQFTAVARASTDSHKAADIRLQADSSSRKSTEMPQDSPIIVVGRGVLLISMFILMLVFLAFGITMAVAVLFVMFAFTLWGVVSASVMAGLHQRSFRKGFKTLLCLLGGILGAIVSTAGWWILVWRFRLPDDGFLAYLLAASVGFASGVLLGWITEWIIGWLLGYFKRQLSNTQR